jgi:hypothetical protein
VTNYSERHHQKVCAMTPGPKPSSGTAMTHAERQSSSTCSVARYRAKQAGRTPTFRYRKPRRRRRATGTPKRVPGLARRDARKHGGQRYGRGPLRAICDLDLSELESIFRTGGLVATKLLQDVKRNQVVAKWNIDGRTLVIINKRIG